jgi:zinc/manganese transport system substrate-binding protein/zinc transport system substrate-binding protein
MRNSYIAVAVLTLFCIGLIVPGCGKKDTAGTRTVLCTTFPIYQITRNVVKDREGVQVQLMLPSQLGCPHDYALTPQDMQTLAKAEVLVVNGLGLEEFLGAPVSNANDKLIVIDSSKGIGEILQYPEGHSCGVCETSKHDSHGEVGGHHHHHHHHSAANPHLFASPRMAAKLALNIAAQLSKADPAGRDAYTDSAKTYAEKMDTLADEMAALGKRLQNNRIVPTHGIFDYLARDMGLEVVAVMQAHGQEPSASEMLALVNTIREKRAGGIFTEPQYPEKVGKTLAKETGLAVALLDPVASGPENTPIDYYETVMRKNMKTLEDTLGVK